MMRRQAGGGTNDEWVNARGDHWLSLSGRLKEGATREQAAAELSNVADRLEQQYPQDRNKNVRVLVTTEQEGRYQDMWKYAYLGSGMALAVVGLILLVACANVANMMLARSVVRRREIAVRLALGAGRWRITRQLLTESVMLSLAGGALGLLTAFWMTDAITSFFPSLAYNISLSVATLISSQYRTWAPIT